MPADPLALLLGYDGAVVEPGSDALSVAPDILEVPFWTSDMCDEVIRAAEHTGHFEPHPDDPVPGHEVSLATISPVLFSHVEQHIGSRIWPLLLHHWPLIEYRGLRDAFVIRYRAGEQTSLRLHNDIAQVSGTVRLSDDYVGADLHFPRQQWDNAHQPVGSALFWPSLVTHPHEVTPLVSGTKYGLTIWCDLPSDLTETFA